MLINKLLCVFLLITATAWEEDFHLAKSKASDAEKPLLIYFSGSDWCANCYRLKSAVLDDTDFNQYANENLVLYNADFPRKRKNQLDQEKKKVNNDLAVLYNKDNVFPKVVLIDIDGNLITEFEGVTFESGPDKFIDHMKASVSK